MRHSIGDTFNNKSNVRDYFLPDTNTHTLADQTNACLQEAVRKDGQAYVQHLDSFIVALREELDSPGGVNARNPPAIDRRPYRMDVKHDGTGTCKESICPPYYVSAIFRAKLFWKNSACLIV